MAESIDTDELRKSAQEWNLEGDRKLLNLLQNIHQNITLRCTETSKRINEMFTSLDHAKVSMDNVNNRFMSLSNTQFVESRVYEDDDSGFVTPQPAVKKSKQEETNSKSTPQQKITAALHSIENNHERVTILDDSDSDTDDEGASVILRPKDVYQNRPLPFIIGSQSWKSKWHAGLIAEDSDAESIGSKKDEELSESDESVAISAPNIHADANSFRSVSPASLPVQDDLYKPDMSKVYRSFAASNTAPQAYLFVDEPPPIDNDTDATSIRTESDSDDIFSELHKDLKRAVQKSVAKSENQNDIDKKQINNRDIITRNDNNKSGLDTYHGESDNFDNESEIDTSTKSNKDLNQSNIGEGGCSKNITEKGVSGDGIDEKKPTGAVSLFGTKVAAKSIGAAILKRNQRKSTSSEDDDEKTNNQAITTKFNQINNQNSNADKEIKDSTVNANTTETHSVKNIGSKNFGQNVIEQIVNKKNKGDKQIIVTEKNIFDELFAKSKEKTSKSKEETKSAKKVDHFSDIFDDIDDIFTSSAKIDKNSSINIKKSVFDDLSSDETSKTNIEEKQKLTRSIFNDDSDLFNEPVTQSERKSQEKSQKNMANDKLAAEVESFASIDNAGTKAGDFSEKAILFNSNDDSDLFKNNAKESKSIEQTSNNLHKKNKKLVRSIFDSDSDDGDIFSVIKAPAVKKVEVSNNINTDIFSEIKNDISSKLPEDELPVDKSSDILHFLNKNNNEKIKIKEDNDNSKDSVEKTISEEISQEINTESSKPITSTDRKSLHITKKNISQNNHILDQSYVSEESMPFDSTRTDDVLIFNEQETNNATTIIQSEYDIRIPKTFNNDINANEGLFPNDIATIEDSQKTATINHIEKDIKNKSIEREFVTNKNKEKIQNDNNSSYIAKTIDIQSNTTITNKIKTSSTDIKVDNVKDLQTDTFDDMFPEEPPEFEKAKESKSNQNVNALFGDDSEDENLFFKKETLISDEKPDNSQVQTIDPLFGVFRDEPPDFDDDFLFKTPTHSAEATTIPVDANNKEALISDSPKTIIPESKDEFNVKKTNIDKESIDNLDLIKERDRSGFLNSKSDQEETDGNTVEPNKTIKKLKPINFNINVANLLPGASPKKAVKPTEPSKLPTDVTLTDGSVYTKLAAAETVSDKIIKDNVQIMEAKNAKPEQVKSVSFDSDPESTVLDTKISKQRARIQVKRRPSTRQARKDAARKSVIEFSENIDTVDSNFKNDDSISIDSAHDQPLTPPVYTKDEFIKSAEINIDNVSKQADIFLNHESAEKEITIDKGIKPNNSSIEISNPKKDLITNLNVKHETPLEKGETSKISNEIVENTPENCQGNSNKHASVLSQNDSTQVLNINGDDIYIFREPKVSKDALAETKITTLGQVYHENTAKDISKINKEESFEKKKSIFDDDDDDLLFSVGNNKKEPIPKTSSFKPNIKPTIFEESNSLFLQKSKNVHSKESTIDDEQDIFSTGNSKKQILPKTTKSHVKPSIFDEEDEQLFSSGNTKPSLKSNKKSLFDDVSDDDDNLFGGKHKTSNNTPSNSGLFTSKLNKMEPKSLKSTLFDEDANDLFGPSSKGAKETKPRSLNAELTKDTNESNEQFEDPLSMFKNEL